MSDLKRMQTRSVDLCNRSVGMSGIVGLAVTSCYDMRERPPQFSVGCAKAETFLFVFVKNRCFRMKEFSTALIKLPRPTMCAKKTLLSILCSESAISDKNVISHASTIPAAPFLLPTFAPGLWGPQLPSLGRFQFIKPSFELQPISLKHSLDLKPRVDPSR